MVNFGVWRGPTVSLRFGGERGLVLKTATPNNDPLSITGALLQGSDSIGRCELQKMEHSIWGCDGTEQLINEGKDQERYGHVEQPRLPGSGTTW